MLRDFFTKNTSLKIMAVVLAVILWAIARYWTVR